jgi:hypothetical protein
MSKLEKAVEEAKKDIEAARLAIVVAKHLVERLASHKIDGGYGTNADMLNRFCMPLDSAIADLEEMYFDAEEEIEWEKVSKKVEKQRTKST